MPLLSAAQVLSGYDSGHGVLAIGGDVSDAERAVVDRLSDLSGYLPLDTTFSSYWTGYPCGQYYAFACTWPDTQAPRSGTVLTHTLLVPRDAVADIADLAALATAFREPRSAADRAPYRSTLAVEVFAEVAAPVVNARAQAIAALWFGQPDRPVLWMEEADAGDVVRVLWRLLWPQARASFAFCTFALGVRRIERRPFDFLALPPAARASFLEWTRSPAWFERGKLPDPGVRHFAGERWTIELLEQGAAYFEPVFALCREHALPHPPPWHLRDALRFVRLQSAATAPLNAARTRADLLFWLWPDLPATHALARAVLDTWLSALPEAVLDRRPLRELQDFLGRKAVLQLAQQEVGFATRAAGVLEREVARRLRESEQAENELSGLLRACEPLPSWRNALLRAAIPAVTANMRQLLSADLLAEAARVGETSWIGDALAPLPDVARADAVRVAAARLEAERARWLWESVGDSALALRDMDLLLTAADALGSRSDWIGRTVALALDTGADVRSLLSKLPAETLLAWALTASTERTLAERIGEESARALGLDLAALAARCAEALPASSPEPAIAARIFVRAAAATTSSLKEALVGRPVLAEHIVRLAVREGPPAALHLREALRALPVDAPCTEGILVELERARRSPWAADAVAWLVPRLVEALRRKAISPEHAARWLAVPETRAYVRRARSWELLERGPEPARGSALAALAGAARVSLLLRADPSSEWVARWILPALDAASADQLAESSEEMSALLAAPLDPETRFSLAMAAFEAVRSKRARGGRAIVERAFPIVYPVLMTDLARPLLWFVRSWLWDEDWDRAKPARRWLLDAWIDWGWPPGSFLRALGNDHALFRRMVARMVRSEKGRVFLQALGQATKEEPELAAAWGADVERALADPHAPVDYE